MSIVTNNQPVARNIIGTIKDKGLKYCAVAKKAGYKSQAFNEMLNGRRVIKASDIMKISSALNVTPNELFSIEKEPAPAQPTAGHTQ